MQHLLDIASGLGQLGDWWRPQAGILSDASQLLFFSEIYDFLSDEIDEFRTNVLGRTMAVVGGLALIVLTMWVFIQGYRIVTGQSREHAMGLVMNALRATLIVAVATTFALGGTPLSTFLTDDLNKQVTYLMTGKEENAYDSIDRSLGYMQIALSSIDAIQVGESQIIQDAKSRNQWFTGIGIAGPAITGGAMLLLNKIAMALVVGLGPLFILCLLFDVTKQLFHKWLWFGVGTIFSLALLSAMVALSLDAVLAVAGSFWTGKFLGASNEGLNSIALQQGGLGMILTTLIVMAPPMAAAFFNGVLGQFTAYSAFGVGAAAGGQRGGVDQAGRAPGSPGYQYQAPVTNQYSQQTLSNSNPAGQRTVEGFYDRASSGTYGAPPSQTLSHELTNQVAPGQSRVVNSNPQSQPYSPSTQPASTRTPPSSGTKGDGNA